MSSSNGQRKRRFDSPREAREQAAEAQGFLASIEIKVGDETYEVPQRGLFDDDQADRMFALELETESWDKDDDYTRADGSVIRGQLKRPYRKGGKLIQPQYAVRVATALWGDVKYAKYKAGGGRAADVTAALAMLDKRLEERTAVDPKSVADDSADRVVGATD